MEVKNEEVIEIKIEDSWGFTEQNYPQLLEIIGHNRPDFWEFLNPSPLLLYFRTRSQGAERGQFVLDKINQLIENNSSYSETTVTSSTGKFIVEFAETGEIKSLQKLNPASAQ